MTSKKLKKLEDVVRPILENDVRARNDDFYLYNEVIGVVCPILQNALLCDALTLHKQMGLPNYESVTRVRRRLQAKYPWLESERMRKRRLKEAEEYKAYAAM